MTDQPRLARRSRTTTCVAVLTLAIVTTLTIASPATADGEANPVTDDIIVGEVTELPQSTVEDMEVTDPNAAADLLEQLVDEGMSEEILTRPMSVYQFDDTVIATTADVEMVAVEGENAAGETITTLAPISQAPLASGAGGYAVPPNSAFDYLRDSFLSETVGTWKREIWYLWNKANNWKSCSECNAHDYFRGTYKMRASTLTGAEDWEGFKRAWIELDFAGAEGYSSFEPTKPEESYKGDNDQTTTIGFGVSGGVNLGAAPKSASGSLNFSYQGTMTRASENWHPVIRAEDLTGGVQWCRFQQAEYVGSKMITARVSAKRAPAGDSQPGFIILRGMAQSTNNCPPQL